jgi:hypothetical protein
MNGVCRQRKLLAATSPDGAFSEQMRESAVDVWRA